MARYTQYLKAPLSIEVEPTEVTIASKNSSNGMPSQTGCLPRSDYPEIAAVQLRQVFIFSIGPCKRGLCGPSPALQLGAVVFFIMSMS